MVLSSPQQSRASQTQPVPVQSSLSNAIERAGSLLQNGALDQIEGYRVRFETLDGLYQKVFANLFRFGESFHDGFDVAKKMFDTPKVSYAAIDGTQYARPLFDLVVFFGGSYAARGEIEYRNGSNPVVTYGDAFLKTGRAVSSCVPIYVNEIPEIDQSFIHPGETSEASLRRPLTDEAIANNSTIPNWIMTFSEFYLGYKLASEPDGPRIILMDRSLANMLASLVYETSRRKTWANNGALLGLEIDGVGLTSNDLAYARHHIDNVALNLPAPRGDYLRWRLILEIEKHGILSLPTLCEKLGIFENGGIRRVERLLKKSIEEGFLEETLGTYSLKERYRTTWLRIKHLVDNLGGNMFEQLPHDNPLRVFKNGDWHWLTTQDLAFLSLFAFNLLIEKCWERRVLLLGLTKDTAARDLKNHVIPVMVSNKVWNKDLTQEQLSRLPNTDRMLLQTLSLFNHKQIPVPWAIVEYDSSFLMTVPDFQHRPGYVSGAIRNRIIPERLFLKTYVQLAESSFDPKLRSNVLSLDRLCYPDFDINESNILFFKHNYSNVDEPVNPIIFTDNNVDNPVQSLVMETLSAMTSNTIPEVFGHNKPLFIADKVAKWHNEEMRRIIDTTGKWLMNSPRLRHFVFYMSTFRERRGEIESARRQNF